MTVSSSKLIKEENKWVSNISKYHDILVFSFMHDIGKTGDGDYKQLTTKKEEPNMV